MRAKESIIYPNFYEIPDYGRYVINKEGIIISKLSNKKLKGSINPKGYNNVRLVSDLGVTLTWGLHRLLCYVFKHPNKPIKGLVVNHEDGIKSNNKLENLEWTTYLGNLYHAGLNNLTNRCIPISVRNTITGSVERYFSATEYAKKIGLSKDAILWRLRKGFKYVFPENKQYCRGHGDVVWPDMYQLIYLNGKNKKPISVKNVLTGKVVTYDKIIDMAADFNVSPSTVTGWIKRKNQPVLPGYIQLKWYYDNTPWRVVLDPHNELRDYGCDVSVKLTQEFTNKELFFDSCIECAEFLKISPTTLSYRLRHNRVKYVEGFIYSYQAN